MLGGKNSKNKHPRGYTIIEVMIVLAVSGVMFLIAANFINGKQAKTAFTEGVNDTASRLQDTIEQVTDGQYSDIPLGCSFTSTPGKTTISNNAMSNKNQGANAPCVFLGKLWYFQGLRRPSPSTSSYQVLSLAGGRVDNSGAVITDLASSYPAVATDLSTTQAVNQQLDVTGIYVNGRLARGNPIKAFGFFQSQGSLDTNGNLATGAQTVKLYYVSDRAFDPASNPSVTGLTPATSISLCLTDDTRYALIDMGTQNGNQLSVNVVRSGFSSGGVRDKC